MSILIQNGVLVLPDGPQRADLRVDGDKIVQLGPSLPAGDSRVLDAAGKLVFPGLIDTTPTSR
jgi:dihydropyrimidinase